MGRRRRFDGCAAPPFLRQWRQSGILSTNLRRQVVRLLLLLPFIGLLAVPLFNQESPELFGFPFFYWYMFAWVPLTSLLIWIVYRNERTED
jgi:hypothetical protein